MRFPALASVVLLHLCSRGELAPFASASAQGEPAPATFAGSVLAEDGLPAEGAVVVTSAGGQAVTGADGAFRIELALPLDAREVQVTAVLTAGSATTTASSRVDVAA